MLASIAWRNLWRNTRRTLLTVAAVAGGLALMVAMYGMMRAWGDRLLEGLTGTYVGHIQIHEEGFRSKRGTAKAISDADLVLDAVRSTEGVEAASGRIYGFAHAAIVRGDDNVIRGGDGDDISAPVVSLLGIEPDHEANVTDLAEKIVKGRWIRDETDVVIGAALAKRIKARVGDAFLPSVVDQNGATRGPWAVSDSVPRVVGIARSGINEMDHRMVFMSREYLARLMNMEDQIHEVAIRTGSPLELGPQVAAIQANVGRARQEANRRESLPSTAPMTVLPAYAVDDGDNESAEGSTNSAQTTPIRLHLVGVEADLTNAVEGGRNSKRLVSGSFIERSEHIVLSQTLARELSASPGDRIAVSVPVDCGEGVASEACLPSYEPFVISGVVEGDEVLSGRFGLVAEPVLSQNIAQLAPTIVASLSDVQRQEVGALLSDVRGTVPAHDEVLAWYDLSPEISEMLTMMESGPIIMLVIVFIAVAMGIINTLLMATFERTREIGLMRALGMGSGRVVAMVMAESAQLAAVGVGVGLALGLAIVWYWSVFGLDLGVFMGERSSFDISGIAVDPVLWPRINVVDLLKTSITVAIITTLAGLWPAIRAARLQPTNALRQD